MTLVYVAALIAMILTMTCGIPYVEFLKKRMYSQFIREDGPKSHIVKEGTPTMGGLVIVVPAILGAVLALIMDQKVNPDVFIVLISFILFTIVGFEDDIKKVTRKQNKGLSAGGKLLVQSTAAIIPALYVTIVHHQTYIFVFDQFSINLGLLYPLFACFIIVGASNAVNLTDGLDGLAAGTSVVAFVALMLLTVMVGRYDLAIISAAVAGSCAGFLYFNKYPAKVFMGDTGSLALGGLLGVIAIMAKLELWLILVGAVFIIETLSVIIQVSYFKVTGKRVFRMSPIHHHFELCGWSETQIVKTFVFVGFVFSLLAVLLKIYLF